jgi:hypothetical protein
VKLFFFFSLELSSERPVLVTSPGPGFGDLLDDPPEPPRLRLPSGLLDAFKNPSHLFLIVAINLLQRGFRIPL